MAAMTMVLINFIIYCLNRDGQLKRMKVKDSWKTKTQDDFSKILKVD